MAGAHRAPGAAVTLREYVESLIGGLRAYVDSRLDEMDKRFREMIAAQDKAVQIAMIASEKAVVKAEVAAEKRFEATNEFRGQLADQAATFMPRVEAEQRMAALLDKIDDLKGSNKAGARALWGYAVGAVGVAGVLVAIVTR
jgi:hypothetical protein